MSPPAVALFDLGGVLLPFDPERRVRAVCEALAIGPEAARAALSADLFARLDVGAADETAFAAAFSEACGRAVDADAARALLLSVFAPPNAAAWDLAGALSRRMPVGGFSDNPAFVRRLFPAGADLDPMFWSAELGATKAGEAAFAAVERRLGVPPAAILFVDDGAGNVERARRRGWDAILYRGVQGLVRELSMRGLP